MTALATALTALVALIHVYIVVLEMFLWDTPRGRAAFGTSRELAGQTKVLAANQGLYNGFLVAGLVLALVGPEAHRYAFALFTLSCVVVAGLFLGINNTLVTETVMKAAPVERGVASAAYSFVRFSGGAVAPWLAGKLGEEINVHVPFYVGAFAVALGVGVLALSRPYLRHIDDPESDESRATEAEREAEAITVGDA